MSVCVSVCVCVLSVCAVCVCVICVNFVYHALLAGLQEITIPVRQKEERYI